VDEEEDDDNGCHKDWIRYGAVKDATAFGDYASVDSELATCGVDTTDELCDDCEGGGSSEEGEEEDECEPEAVPSFATTCCIGKSEIVLLCAQY
jgi:hypothetical protein